MNYFLDTNTCVYYLKGSYPLIDRRLRLTSHQRIKIPSTVKAELLYGAQKSIRRDKVLASLEKFLFPFEVVPFGDACADHYAQIRADIERNGHPIGANDLIIAAIVRADGGVLVTHNVDEFSRVKGLAIQDWTA